MALIALKKRAKVSYSALGLDKADVALLDKALAGKFEDKPHRAQPKPKPVKPTEPLAPIKPQTMDRKAKARYLFNEMTDQDRSPTARKQSAQQLLAHKKATKQSWTALGLPEDVVKTIDNLVKTSN